ncbi:MAG: hypothetical protein E6J91_48750 [Deltaproteobacteria bacterium]|nr:MAG: hypothetical protein E6J91_48750 [Deltaproteobacteria bacterium]
MKLDIADFKTLSDIAPGTLTAYLRSRGWAPLRVEHELGFFHKQIDGEDVECDVPLRQNARDYPRRIREVLENLTLIESRSQYEIYQDLVRTNQDIVRISIDVPESGRVGLDEAGVLFSAARDLVLAAACSAHTRRAYFPRRKPQRAVDYVRHVNLAAPEAGSFVVVLESPLPAPFGQQQALGLGGEPAEDEPFERTVLVTLATAAVTAQKSIEISTARGSVERFSDDVGAGVNANYCDALATMLEEGPGRDVAIAFSWSTSRPMTFALPPRLVFSKNEAPVLRAASKFLKDRAPVADFELIGQVVRLKALAPARGGNVTIAGLVDDAIRQVQLSAGPDDYQRAIEAHQHERIVSVEGELIKDGRSFRLSNPRMFSVAS